MTKTLPTQRRLMIIEWLEVTGSVSIDEMIERFGVSNMTIHRDLEQLEAEGRLRKVRGGALPVQPRGSVNDIRQALCAECGKPVSSRSAWIITPADGPRRHTCCAHCGLLNLRHQPDARSALAADFLYGQMVNVFQASFVIDSEVTLCCVPSVLCFASREDADRFCLGFRGRVLNFGEATGTVANTHHNMQHH